MSDNDGVNKLMEGWIRRFMAVKNFSLVKMTKESLMRLRCTSCGFSSGLYAERAHLKSVETRTTSVNALNGPNKMRFLRCLIISFVGAL